MNKNFKLLLVTIMLTLLIFNSYGIMYLIYYNDLGIIQECMILNEEYQDGIYTIDEIKQTPYGEMCIEKGYINEK